MIRLHDNLSSGNGYKARLLLAQLGVPFRRIEYDIDRAQTRTPEFLRINPNGRIPVLELEDGRFLPESNAILFYLAEGTPFLPDDRFGRAQVLSWMFFEQYSHEPNIATPRYWITHDLPMTEERRATGWRRSPATSRSAGFRAADPESRRCQSDVSGAYDRQRKPLPSHVSNDLMRADCIMAAV